MNFIDLRDEIRKESQKGDFGASSNLIQNSILSLNKQELIPLITEIGVIPEDIRHDSSEEKLFSKVSDILLAKCFQELGLKSTVNKERSSCADVVAKSNFHGYTLVGDAKSFRLSRTAKNQKDFKVKSMADWREDNDYAVLVCPYYQYPKSKSQIYGQALNQNVSLFAWEYFAILLENNIFESESLNVSKLWNISFTLSANINVAERNNCFLSKQDIIIRSFMNLQDDVFNEYFEKYRNSIVARGEDEIQFWKNKIAEIKQYTREKAIEELLISLKLNAKIASIKRYIDSLR
ncbi:MAG: HindIII family type II restriction endonuclease [Planctomycetaceae bacterium]|jgi:type II restriction enzyme|nr:HindIII family type II restriction endonuclease [Planctomycetaceae bacterium]